MQCWRGHGAMAPQTAHGQQQQQQHPNSTPFLGQQGCGPVPVNVPVLYPCHNPTPLTCDGSQPYHYAYNEGDQRRSRDYSRDRKPYRSSRDSKRRDSRDSRDRRYSSQESDYDRRRHGDSQDRKHRNKSRRRSERSPSPPSSGVGRGGGRRERDQSTRREEARGRGRGNQEKRVKLAMGRTVEKFVQRPCLVMGGLLQTYPWL